MIDVLFVNPSDDAVFGNSDTVGMDVAYNEDGTLRTISGRQRLAQSIQKMVITETTGDINKVADFGTRLPSLIGEKADPFFMKPFIVTTITNALTNYKNMQQQKSNDFNIPNDEQLRGLVEIKVQDIQGDRNRYAVIVTIQNEKEEIFNITLSLPKNQG